MKLSDFDYTLPKELIAQRPAQARDTSRMLVLERPSGKISHRIFSNIVDYIKRNDVVVLNDTRVIKARLTGKREGFSGKIEALLIKQIDSSKFACLIKPSKKVRGSTKLVFGNGDLCAKVLEKNDNEFILDFMGADVLESLERLGAVPLPPYIKRRAEEVDSVRYQTVYAKTPGAVAAPTAGLHFTEKVLQLSLIHI